ncbi:MAG: hypothetical protein KC503_00160 [Myxococcales bacterium]|nr:hypothetical protein [Myxococcales bacterium]
MMQRLAISSALLVAASCATGSDSGVAGGAPAAVTLTRVAPTVLLPRSVVIVEGVNLARDATHMLVLSGRAANGVVSQTVPLERLDERRARFTLTEGAFAAFGAGSFSGSASVISSNGAAQSRGPALALTLSLTSFLRPALQAAGDGVVFLNDGVRVEGADLLVGSSEGSASAELSGCFVPAGQNDPRGDCSGAGARTVSAQLPLEPDPGKADLVTRSVARFAFAPSIAGIKPGRFRGTLTLANNHASGVVTRSQPLLVQFDLQRSRLVGFDQVKLSYGQRLAMRGDGFIGDVRDGVTVVRFDGQFESAAGSSRAVSFEIVGTLRSGHLIETVLEGQSGIASVVDPRSESGILRGKWTPTVRYGGESVEGDGMVLGLEIGLFKQVVWLAFADDFAESLRPFGLRLADERIRRRVLEIVRRDYQGLNIEISLEEPKQFARYTRVDVAGRDPAGLGLDGYDKAAVKDKDNAHVHEHLGGAHALRLADGRPGYGGLFVESLLGFSKHPPAGVASSPALSDARFDVIFDAVRRDRGVPASAAELVAAPLLSDTAGCLAASADRALQVACAARALANLVGHAVSHQLGHALGLADPYGAADAVHNAGDVPRRLMDRAELRPFGERAELDGEGPALFCFQGYQYLRGLLRGGPPAENAQDRPSCY